jgi:alkanesulfonate monooxygenase SsuD/methylene tetrahydromethanopterin reductase-like flavin-dependent oxidoreductase (luciferase family)
VTDYGHDLILGTLLTPQDHHPSEVVALARLTEDAGLDLVTFVDHPHDPGLLDTWTLMSYVAAHTERVRLSGYAVNLPSRPPAVLARAAASLDLLSSGRVELGLGPGDHDIAEEIAAMGGPRYTGPESVRALSEAIDIIRGIWDPSELGRVRLHGEHYEIRGALRGPQPAHAISIWVPAAGPITRRLAGSKADGWITGAASMTDVETELAVGNKIVDDAAKAVGRDPRHVRRIFDFHGSFGVAGGFARGRTEQWVEQLLPLAVEQGMSVFVLISDDAHTIERWGLDVGPALREAVARERGGYERARLAS